LRVLIVAPSYGETAGIERALTATFTVRAAQVEELDALPSEIDIGDLDLIVFSAERATPVIAGAIARFHEQHPALPIVVVVPDIEQAEVVRITQAGADDLVPRGQLWHLAPAVRRALQRASERLERYELERRLASLERRYLTLVEELPVAFYVTSILPDALDAYVSPAIEDMFGYSRAEWLDGRARWADIVHPEDAPWVLGNWERTILSGQRWSADYRTRTKDGRTLWIHDEAVRIVDENGEPFAQGMMTDISARKQAEEQLQYQALHDSLTGLPNRLLFNDRLRQFLLESARELRSLALLLVDLDHFKEVNDTYGHGVGDTVLRRAGERFSGALRRHDTVARLGGDEFAVLLAGTGEPGARRAAEKLCASLREPITADGLTLNIGCSIGVVLHPRDGDDAETLQRCADIAMYTAKRAGGGYAVYQSEIDPHSVEQIDMIAALRRAIEHHQIAQAYQPVVDHDGRPVRLEVFARWTDQQLGPVPPHRFIPLAEQAGLTGPLTALVLDQSSRQAAEWAAMGLPLPISVNLSARNLQDDTLLESIRRALATGIAPGGLTLETTESALMADPMLGSTMIAALHELGARIAIDDFGTGYSSLASLQRMSVDELKIDRSFVCSMDARQSSAVIVKSAIDLAHNLGLVAVAEGVETAEQLHTVVSMGCDLVQGYHLCPPLAPGDVPAWLGER
jgi:diguanylate cyclase (GGDEF)-like protein/PAS domain S-box-containing protein